MSNQLKLTLMGAGGKMGCRITDNIKDLKQYDVAYVEVSDEGQARLAERGVTITSQEEALVTSDAVILALPDKLIGTISEVVVPQLSTPKLKLPTNST